MLKQNVLIHALEKINSKIKELEIIADEVKSSLLSDSKSSAGDKHETARAMVQLEQEKLTKQINELLKLQENLQKINPTIVQSKIGLGSLVETNNGIYYFSVGIGPVTIDNQLIFALNPKAPIGELLTGKTKGDKIQFNGKITEILSVQ